MSDKELFLVEYQDRDPNTGNYIVKKVVDGEILSVPAAATIFILSLAPGQMLLLFCPQEHQQGYLFAPI
ncbi:hypothetical protein [Chroococcidiopsis sp. CCMEE 29]|uniref:hypothetical protein n=1 Tax=Chroococcidiopsis sp. CCMEE 29 TaxID=155894 RepID=UPI00202284F2|nr:hypothetical protein [Chroococcidiopsis sp. CCMEE 29]